MKQEYFYLSDVEFDLMTNDELISFFGDEDYQYEQYLLEKEAMETSYQHVK